MIFASGVTGAVVFAVLAMIGYGFVDFIAYTLSKNANPFKMPMWNVAISLLILSPGLFFFKFPQITTYDIFLLALGTIAATIATLSFYKALKMGKLAVIIPITNSWAIITVLVGLLVLNETLIRIQVYGIILTIMGTIVLSFKFHDIIKLKFDKVATGAEYAFFSMIFWGILFSVMGILAGQMGWFWPSYIMNFFFVIILFIYNKARKLDVSFPTSNFRRVLLQGALVGASFLVYNYSATFGYLAITGAIAGSSPLPTLIIGRFLTKERMEANQFIGVASVLIGIILIAL